MAYYNFDLDVLNKLTGSYIDIINLSGGGIGLAPGNKLIFDKGIGDICDYYDSCNSRRVMTMGGSDAIYLENSALDIIGRLIKNPKGLGGANGNLIRFVSSSSELKPAIEAAQNKIVWVLPGTYTVNIDCKNDPITVPDHCFVVAYGAEIRFRNQNPEGLWIHEMININNIHCEFIGGTWWIDRANSVENDARRLFECKSGAKVVFRDCTLSNNSGREAICGDGSSTEIICYNCIFKPQQNTYTDNNYLYVATGAIAFVTNCIFDGFQEGENTTRCLVGMSICPYGYMPIKITSSVFSNLKCGIEILHYNTSNDGYGPRISNCEFIDMNSTSNILSSIYFKTKDAASAGYNLVDTTIESCKFRGGSTAMAQIGTRRYDTGHTGLKRLVIRNCTMIAHGEGTTAKYAIDFREAGSGETAVEIAEISNVICSSGYGSDQINLASGISVGKYDVTLES